MPDFDSDVQKAKLQLLGAGADEQEAFTYRDSHGDFCVSLPGVTFFHKVGSPSVEGPASHTTH